MKTKSLLAKRLVVLAMAVGLVATFVPRASALEPCCNITKIDTRNGVVTAHDRTTGHTFQFTASPAVLQTIKGGQGVYANYKTNQVSLDGRNACCNIVKSGALPPASPTSPRVSANPGGVIRDTTMGASPIESSGATATSAGAQSAISPAQLSTRPIKPQLLAQVPKSTTLPPGIEMVAKGNQWQLQRVTGVYGEQTFSGFELYYVAGIRGLSDAPLPKNIKDALLADARNSDPRDTLYIVPKDNAEKWDSGQLQRQYESQQNSGGVLSKPNDRLPSGTPQIHINVGNCFGWQSVNQQVSASFSTTGQLFSWTIPDDPGNNGWVSGNLKVAFPVQGNASLGLGFRVLQQSCVPVALKFKNASGSANMTLGANFDVDVNVNLQHDFEWELVKAKLQEYHLGVAGLPIYVELDAFADAVIHLEADHLVEVKYAVSGSRTGSLQASCTMTGCTGSGSFSQNPVTITRNIDFASQGLRAVIKPYLFGGLMANIGVDLPDLGYTPSLAVIKLGPAPYVQADLWAYYGPCSGRGVTGSGLKNGPNVSAATGDLDFGLDIRAKAWSPLLADSVGLPSDWVGSDWILDNWNQHVAFFVLGDSPALSPLIDGNLTPVSNYPSTYTLQMRPCYPYNDRIDYRVDWGDGSAPSVSTAPPHSVDSIRHTYQGKTTYLLSGTPLKDEHGRIFPTQNTTLSLNTQYQLPGGQSLPATSGANSTSVFGRPTDRALAVPSSSGNNAPAAMAESAPTTTPGSVGARAGTSIAPVNDSRTKGIQVIPPQGGRVTGTQVLLPNGAKVGGSQIIPPDGTRVGSNQVSPPPCCQITSIGKSGVVTAIDKTTGHSFQFTASPSVQQSLKVGQPVYANFKNKQVSLNNLEPCCQIR